MQKPKEPSSPVKLEANFPISNANMSETLNKAWTLNVETGFCTTTAPGSTTYGTFLLTYCSKVQGRTSRGHHRDFYFKKRNCSTHWGPFTNI